MGIVLGRQQTIVHGDLMRWHKAGMEQLYELSGLAGTGKTTIIKYFIDSMGLEWKDVIFCSFMGKAVQRMNSVGLPAKTIHSVFYHTEQVPILDANGQPIKELGRVKTKPVFKPVDEIPKNIKLIVIDEGGTVGESLAKNVLKHGIPTIVLGDINQLPPVLDKQYFLENPNFHLTEIMRQAEGDPIVLMSRLALQGKDIPIGNYGRCRVVDFDDMPNSRLLEVDTVLASTNFTREKINDLIRVDLQGRDREFISRGDKLICRQNNWDISVGENICLVNGLVGYVENYDLQSFNGNRVKIDISPDFMPNVAFSGIDMDLNYFKATPQERKNFGRTQYNKFEPGSCITVHLSQGSEYDDVMLFEESFGNADMKKRLLYTGITRAKRRLDIIKKPKGGYYNYDWESRGRRP